MAREQINDDVYRDLTISNRGIRLCTINKADLNGIVECSLQVVNWDEHISYRCLSYVWGSPKQQRKIKLGGCYVSVTKNLNTALRQMWASGIQSDIWIDALSINQKDDVERAEQVTMMGQIYARAQEVIIWLGIDMYSGPRSLQSYPGATIPSTADATVTHIMKLLADNKHFHELPIVAHCKAQSCPCTPRGGTHELGDAASVLKALNTVFGSQWFTRAWAVQEIVLAKKATLLLETLPGSAADIIYQISCRVLEITEAKQSYESGQHIVQCLLRFNGRECLDPLDKLYGLLALQSSKTPTPITPNYKSSLQELFSRFALDTIATQGWLVPFCLDLEQLKPNLPSWVPDWTVRTKSPMIYAANRFSSSSTYDAAKGFGGELEVDETYTLGLDGIDVG